MKAFLYMGLGVVGLLYLTSKPGELQITLPPKKEPVLPPKPIVPTTTTTTATSTSGPVTPAKLVPIAVTKSISDAIASLDPDVIKTTAAALDKQGFNQQAADLRAFSAGMMNAMNKA